jgi:hypothetical protein
MIERPILAAAIHRRLRPFNNGIMRPQFRTALVLATFLGSVLSGLGQGSMFYFTSTPQSIIGQGETFTASSTNGFTISAERNVNNGVSLIISSETRYWFLDFAAAGSVQLTSGTYNNPSVVPTPSTPGLLFSGEGRSVSTIGGYFNIITVDYGPGNTINQFEANFVQYDEGDINQANSGTIRFGLTPVPEPGIPALALASLLALMGMSWRRRRH